VISETRAEELIATARSFESVNNVTIITDLLTPE
jgi:hypothetical protein